MNRFFILLVSFSLIGAGILKEDNLPGVDVEIQGNSVRYVTPPAQEMKSPNNTVIYDRSRAETLWVDRNHQYAIAEHVGLSGNGMNIQTGWWLNNERTSNYRTLGNNIPVWSYPMPLTEGYVPVDVSLSGEDIAVGGTGEPFYSFSTGSPAPKWIYQLPDGYKIATSTQGPSVAVSEDGSIYAVLGRITGNGRLFIFNNSGDTIRTISFNPTYGIYGLDITSDGTIFCISTYYAIYIYELSGTRRDSLSNYGQTVAKISTNGKYIVKGDFFGRTYLYRWSGSNYTLKWQHQTGHPWVTAVAISDSGSTIMAGTFQYSPSYSGKVLMYDSSSATPLWEYTQYGDLVEECALTPNGERGAAVSWGQYNGTFGDVLTVFNRSSPTPIFQLLDDIDEPGSLLSVDISRDGSFVTAGGKAVHARQMGNGGEVYAIRILENLTSDVGVKSIGAPGNFLQVGQSITPQATIKNYGTISASFNTVCAIYDSLSALIYVDTIFVNNLASGAEQTLNFSPNWTVPAYGRYTTVAYTLLGGDLFPANDTLHKGSICYHDGAVTRISYPFSELTLNYTRPPRATIVNNGSYSENIPVTCKIYDSGNNLVYTGTAQAFLSPLQSTTLYLSPPWTPNAVQTYTTYIFTNVVDDYNRSNDTMHTTTNVTTEILYDDGILDIYGYVSTNYYDNKFAEKMVPCLPPPYNITQARFYVSTAAPIIMSLNADSSGLPGLGPAYYIAPPETIYPSETGWAVKVYSPSIVVNSTNPFWFVVHWLSSSPSSPYIGMDNTVPLDSLSYWYWTEPSNPGWHAWVFYDFMMRVSTTSGPGITEGGSFSQERFVFYDPMPNPSSKNFNTKFVVPKSGKLKINIYDASGRLVRCLLDARIERNTYNIIWDGRDSEGRRTGAGIYFVKIDYNDESITKKLVLIR